MRPGAVVEAKLSGIVRGVTHDPNKGDMLFVEVLDKHGDSVGYMIVEESMFKELRQ